MKLWTGVVTDKLRESKDFYVRLFGCEVIYESDWVVLLQLGSSELGFMLPNLESNDRQKMSQPPGSWLRSERRCPRRMRPSSTKTPPAVTRMVD
jgi:catechol 2,3-dioxygenase-like lactoylglutathione lyase family enzyme